ncbi:MAG: cation diffusion facilitator family transporter [Candidatus Eremiobacteraeota bacterium]|nr:cation diffusion facilitator family transporter [Candidatus Eremiobacteraeota bacterium]
MAESEVRTLRNVVIIYFVVFVLKLSFYFLSGVMVLFAEALHTLCDLFISGFLLIALIWSGKSDDERHRFGHGRAQNVAALVAATLFISFTSFKLYEEAIPRLIHPEEVHYRNLNYVLAVLIISMVIAAAPLLDLIRQKKRGAAAKAQMLELINDEFGLFAALFGTLSIMRGFPQGDPIASLAVATVIAVNAVLLFRENLNLLLGVSPGKAFIDKITGIAESFKGVLNVHNIRAEYVGPETVHVDLHIVVPRGMLIEEADRISKEMSMKIKEETNSLYCTIHVNAAKEDPQGTAGISSG